MTGRYVIREQPGAGFYVRDTRPVMLPGGPYMDLTTPTSETYATYEEADTLRSWLVVRAAGYPYALPMHQEPEEGHYSDEEGAVWARRDRTALVDWFKPAT